MSDTPAWLRSVFDANDDALSPGKPECDRLAAAIVDKLTELAPAIAACAASAAHAQLTTRGIKDGAGDIAKQIGKNAAQSILMLLERTE